MLRVAVQYPSFPFAWADFNGNRTAFVKKMKPIIYCPGINLLTSERRFKKTMGENLQFDPEEYEFVFSESELNRKADVLIYFNQYPVNLKILSPPRGFRGLKVWHIFEYVFHATAVNKMLENNGVDFLLGYSDHGKHCPFFQKYYPRFVDKVIPFPFGTSDRFIVDTEWEKRKQKVIALGSINLVNEPGVANGALKEYAKFYSHKKFTHEWRRMLAENEQALKPVMDSQLPHYPQMKNAAYDAVEMLTNYSMFANDEGLLAFPPARTYEGPAAGSVMISSDHSSYSDLGFIDGVNCVMHKKHDLTDFENKAKHYLKNPDLLRTISRQGQDLIRNFYTHDAIADRLAIQLETILTTGKKPDPFCPTHHTVFKN